MRLSVNIQKQDLSLSDKIVHPDGGNDKKRARFEKIAG